MAYATLRYQESGVRMLMKLRIEKSEILSKSSKLTKKAFILLTWTILYPEYLQNQKFIKAGG
jgi:hypothetical protein